MREVVRTPNGLEALAQVMRYFLEVNDYVSPEALQALLERESGPGSQICNAVQSPDENRRQELFL